MIENSNRAIAINSLFLYIKLIVATVTGLVTTRYALLALGVVDYGLFAVLGSVISFIGIFNSIMLSSSNRFISVAIGKGDINDINEQFNINLVIHLSIAVITIVIALTIGDWYVRNHINFAGDINKALKVFHYSMLGSVLSSIGVPFNGLLMAKERFMCFCVTDIIFHVFKMVIAILLVNHFTEKLLVFAFSQALLTGTTTIVYYAICKRSYPEIVKFHFSTNKEKYKDMLSFSSWVAFGAVATVTKTQGAALLVNAFFSTAMNTALGLANTVGTLANSFANSIAQPMSPQITKSYAVGNIKRSEELVVMSTKYTYLVMLLICAPFIVNAEWIFSIWLGQIPDYAISFTHLIVIDSLVMSFNLGVSNVVFASGNIKAYQVVINCLRLSAIGVAYLLLKCGCDPESLLYSYICFSFLIIFVGQIILRKVINFNTKLIIRQSFIPSIIVTCMFLLGLLFPSVNDPLLGIVLAELWLLLIVVVLGLSRDEKSRLLLFMKEKFGRKNKVY